VRPKVRRFCPLTILETNCCTEYNTVDLTGMTGRFEAVYLTQRGEDVRF
jgi:hypothetical protein